MFKRILFPALFLIFLGGALLTTASEATAQCAICTRTAQQLGAKPASALNKGIIYLAAAPLAIFCIIGYRWWRNNRDAG